MRLGIRIAIQAWFEALIGERKPGLCKTTINLSISRQLTPFMDEKS